MSFASFFAWVDRLSPEKKAIVSAEWYRFCAGKPASVARDEWIKWCVDTQGYVPSDDPPPPKETPTFAKALQEAHPQFRGWYLRQPETMQQEVRDEWQRIEGHPDIEWGSKNAEHARLSFLIQWAKDFGYGQ